MRWTLAFTIGLLLACSGAGTPTETTPQPPEPAPREPAPEAATAGFDVLDAYGYAPGRRFWLPEPGAEVFVGVDGAKLRSAPDGEAGVVRELAHGAKVEVLEVVGDPVELIGRTHKWVKVRTDGVEGHLFGALLTPFGGTEGTESGEVVWTVTWSKTFEPLIRMTADDGDTESLVLPVTNTFEGGTLEASVDMWGDFGLRLDVTQCTVDKLEIGPRCVTGSATWGDGPLVALTVPDAHLYTPDPLGEAACNGAPVAVTEDTSEELVQLVLPSYMRGPGTNVSCSVIGRFEGGPHKGKEVVSCGQDGSGKEWPPSWLSAAYVRLDDKRWGRLPCAGQVGEYEVHLGYEGIKVVDGGPVRLAGRFAEPPETLRTDSQGTANGPHHWPGTLPDGELDKAFDHATLGPVFRAKAGAKGVEAGLLLPRPEGGFVQYGWSPDLADLSLDGVDEPSAYVSSDAMHVDFHLPGLTKEGLKAVGTAKAGPLYGLAGTPTEADLLETYRSQLGAEGPGEHAFLAVEAPFGGLYLVVRQDLQRPLAAEPILYASADARTPLSIRFGGDLELRGTRPITEDGWDVVVRPDGYLEHDGALWDRLFWDGMNGRFPEPEQGWVVPGPSLETFLRELLFDRGFRGRAIDQAMEAWLPTVEGAAWVRVGYHPRSSIDQLAPLALDPVPDTFERVLIELRPLDEPVSIVPPVLAPVKRQGLVVVEWGYVERAR